MRFDIGYAILLYVSFQSIPSLEITDTQLTPIKQIIRQQAKKGAINTIPQLTILWNQQVELFQIYDNKDFLIDWGLQNMASEKAQSIEVYQFLRKKSQPLKY